MHIIENLYFFHLTNYKLYCTSEILFYSSFSNNTFHFLLLEHYSVKGAISFDIPFDAHTNSPILYISDPTTFDCGFEF